jgi:hypothetical protein
MDRTLTERHAYVIGRVSSTWVAMPMTGRLQAVLSAVLTLSAAAPRAPGETTVEAYEWRIGPSRLGRLDLRRAITVEDARVLYPEAEVSLDGSYFVVRVQGVELFRSDCLCSRDRMGRVVFPSYPGRTIRDANQMLLQPFTADRRFKTDRGIGVGATASALARAYREFGRLHYFRGEGSEYACFYAGRKSEGPRAGTIEWLRFYLAPRSGREHAGKLGRSGGLSAVDPSATITAIQPNTPCEPYGE